MNVREAGCLGSTSEQEAKMARTRIGGTIASMLLLGSVVTALPGEAKYRIEDGEIVLDSPFELEIGWRRNMGRTYPRTTWYSGWIGLQRPWGKELQPLAT